ADGLRHADTEGDGKGQEDREYEVKGVARLSLPARPGLRLPRRAATSAATARPVVACTALAASAALGAYAALRRVPPAGEDTWARTNHRGETVTLLEGPALTVGAVAAQVITGAVPVLVSTGSRGRRLMAAQDYPERVRPVASPLAIAGLGGMAFGVL